MAARSADGPIFAILIQHRSGQVICDLQAVRYAGGGFAAMPYQPPDLLAAASVASSASGFAATCFHPAGDGWNSFTVTSPDSGAALQALLDLTANFQARTAPREAPVYLVSYPAFDTAADGTRTRTIGLRLVGHQRHVTSLGHVHETYLGVDGRRVEVYRYRRGNPRRATRLRFTDPGTASLLLTAQALDRLARACHIRSRLFRRVLRHGGRD